MMARGNTRLRENAERKRLQETKDGINSDSSSSSSNGPKQRKAEPTDVQQKRAEAKIKKRRAKKKFKVLGKITKRPGERKFIYACPSAIVSMLRTYNARLENLEEQVKVLSESLTDLNANRHALEGVETQACGVGPDCALNIAPISQAKVQSKSSMTEILPLQEGFDSPPPCRPLEIISSFDSMEQHQCGLMTLSRYLKEGDSVTTKSKKWKSSGTSKDIEKRRKTPKNSGKHSSARAKNSRETNKQKIPNPVMPTEHQDSQSTEDDVIHVVPEVHNDKRGKSRSKKEKKREHKKDKKEKHKRKDGTRQATGIDNVYIEYSPAGKTRYGRTIKPSVLSTIFYAMRHQEETISKRNKRREKQKKTKDQPGAPPAISEENYAQGKKKQAARTQKEHTNSEEPLPTADGSPEGDGGLLGPPPLENITGGSPTQ